MSSTIAVLMRRQTLKKIPIRGEQVSLRRVILLFLAGGAVIYGAYAGRRVPVPAHEGTGLTWPVGAAPLIRAQMRISTYNIHRGKGLDGVRNLDRIAEVIGGADLMVLNEVGGPPFPRQWDQAHQMGELLGVGWLYAPNQRRWHMDHFGNALLSRVAIGGWRHTPLVYHREESHSHRSLLETQITLQCRPVTVLATHLDRGAIRPVQLQFVLQLFQTHRPAMLLGDFNTTERDPILSAFLADANNVDAIGFALGDADDSGRVDWILTRGLDVLNGGMKPVGASDHPFYWVDVTLSDPVSSGTLPAGNLKR